jgi:hypothetical protein
MGYATLKREAPIPVLFRKWRKSGDVIALFPTVLADCSGGGSVESYEHVGQHGGADFFGIMRESRPAKPKEYASLARELRAAPFRYRLKVVKRASRAMHDKFLAEYTRYCRR